MIRTDQNIFVTDIFMRLEEDLPILLGLNGNKEKVMKNKKKAVELVSNMAALLLVAFCSF